MCLRIRRGRSLSSVLGKPHIHLSSLRIAQTKIEACFAPEHVLTRFISRLPTRLPLNKSEVLTGRPFSGQKRCQIYISEAKPSADVTMCLLPSLPSPYMLHPAVILCAVPPLSLVSTSEPPGLPPTWFLSSSAFLSL